MLHIVELLLPAVVVPVKMPPVPGITGGDPGQ